MAIERQFNRLRISVVIPARKAQATIGQCLRSLETQVRKPDEVIIVINPPEDPTFVHVKELSYKLSLPIKILLSSEGVGSARNIGVAAASGDIIAFIDSDEVAHPYWLQYIEKVFIENPEAMVVGGSIIYVESLDQMLINLLRSTVFSCSLGHVYNIRTGNMAFKKSVINLVGNFDPWFKVCHEDTDFIFRLIEYKIKMLYCENIIVYHVKKKISTLQEISRAFYIGQHNARLFAKHPKITTLKIFYINLGHAFLITLGAIIAVITKILTIPALIIMPSIIYRIVKTVMKKNLRLMMRQLTLGYAFDFLFTLGFSAEITNILIKRLRNA